MENNKANGTPRNLRQAIRNGINSPPSQSIEDGLYKHVRDFLSQHFTVSMLSVVEGSVEHVRLQVLFDRLTREEN